MNKKFNQEEFDKLTDEIHYVMTDMICRAGSEHLSRAVSLIVDVDPQNLY